jgi:hypothetical protein
VHLNRGGEAGEERRVQVGQTDIEVRQISKALREGVPVSQPGAHVWELILHSQPCRVRSLMGDDD